MDFHCGTPGIGDCALGVSGLLVVCEIVEQEQGLQYFSFDRSTITVKIWLLQSSDITLFNIQPCCCILTLFNLDQGQVGQDLEQPGLAESVLAHGRGIRN